VLRVFLAPIAIGVTQYISAYRFNESLNLGITEKICFRAPH